jgi:hypothetical protein
MQGVGIGEAGCEPGSERRPPNRSKTLVRLVTLTSNSSTLPARAKRRMVE